jgi:hypothetical protein
MSSPTNEEDEAASGSSFRIAKLLKEQYQCTEDYCNATTALHNALQQQTSQACGIGGSNNLFRATQHYQDVLHRVQKCLGSLEKLIEDLTEIESTQNRDCRTTPLLECLQQHLARTRRILATIYKSSGEGSSFHSNGLPTPKQSGGGSDTNARLVALATLRASIKTVLDKF